MRANATTAITAICGLILALPLVLVPIKAQALSCMPKGIKGKYLEWRDAKENYVIVRGTLRPIQPIPKSMSELERQNSGREPEAVTYQFNGIAIGKNKNITFNTSVEVIPHCQGPWCGGYPQPNGSVITAFAHRKDGSYAFYPGPCGDDYFSGNITEQEQVIRNCMNDKACKAEKVPLQPSPMDDEAPNRPAVRLKLH